MRGNGITYDTGFLHAGGSTGETFDSGVVKQEMRIIHDDLHCNAVRITGGDAVRLETAARHAADAGLEVWFCAFTCVLPIEELLAFVDDSAERAERLRRLHPDIVFLLGSELSLFNGGFLPGGTLADRLGLLTAQDRLREVLRQVPQRINDFPGHAAAVARTRFGAKLSYASLPFERVDWTPFAAISTDAADRRAR